MAATSQNRKWSYYKQMTHVQHEGEFCEAEHWLAVYD